MYDFTRDLDEAGKKNLRDFVESGGGVVVLHHALLNYQNWAWWYRGGRRRQLSAQREGDRPSSSVKNDQQISVTPAGKHPITAGIGPFQIDGRNVQEHVDFADGPAAVDHRQSRRATRTWPGSGPMRDFRVVAIQLGHGHTAFGNPSYRALVHNAILWAAGQDQVTAVRRPFAADACFRSHRDERNSR